MHDIAQLAGEREFAYALNERGLDLEHIGVAQDNELLVVAPATADLLAKFAHGLADDFLRTLYLAFTERVVLAPAMNTMLCMSRRFTVRPPAIMIS